MIVVQLNGGLGNQMFQYAYGLYISKLNNCQLYLDLRLLKYYPLTKDFTKRNYELNIFSLEPKLIDANHKIIRILLKNKYFFKLSEWLYLKQNKLKVYNENYHDLNQSKSSKLYLKGHFQGYSHLPEIEKAIKDHFSFSNKLDNRNLVLQKQMRDSNSISVHIRRGDYLKSNNLKKHGILSIEYYEDAIAYINKIVTKPHFYIFSDDSDWVSENLNVVSHTFTCINHNTGKDSYKDLQLMANCKHNIIANSTFSWWGAWLNNNKNKIVVGPKHWYNNSNKKSHILPITWIKL